MYERYPTYRFYKQDKPLRRIWADGYTQVECVYITASILNILKSGAIVTYGDYDEVNPYWLDKYTYRNLFAGIITTCVCLAIGSAGLLHVISPLTATLLILATLPVMALLLLLLPKESLLEEIFSTSNPIDAELSCPLTPLVL